MMKLKKLLCVVLAGALTMAALGGCASSKEEAPNAPEAEAEAEQEVQEEPETGAETKPAAEPVSNDEIIKVGFITWSITDTLNTTVQRGFDMFGKDLGFEVHREVYVTADDMVSCAQNLIQKGCKLIINVVPSAALLDVCAENGAYLVCWANTVDDPELQAYLEQSPYWIGTDSISDHKAATDVMQVLYDNGARNFGIVTEATMNTNINIRYNAAKEFIEQHEDAKLVGEVGVNGANDVSNGIANMLSINSEVDAFFLVGSSNGWAEAGVAALEAEGMAGKIHFGTIDWVDSCSEWLQNGYVDAVAAGQFPDLMFNVINGCNVIRGAYEGNRVLDGHFLVISGKEGYEDYVKYFDGEGVYPYSLEQLQSVSYYNNPDVTYEDLHNLWAAYDMQDVIDYWQAQE